MTLLHFPRPSTSGNRRGFTLIEFVFTLVLLGLLSVVAISIRGTSLDGVKYDETREKMLRLRQAIVGSTARDSHGNRTDFGYAGDVGSLPAALLDLVTQPAGVASWTFEKTYGFGRGWRGPYDTPTFSNEFAVDKDAWGTAFLYDPLGSPPTLTSFGANKVAGGTSYSADLALPLSDNLWKATVRGKVLDGKGGLSGRTVTLYFAENGNLASQSVVTLADGSFVFGGIPFGPRAIAVVTAPALGPMRFVSELSETLIPPSLLNYDGDLQKVSFQAGSAGISGANLHVVDFKIDSTHDINLTLKYMTLWWTAGTNAFLSQITINGTTQNISPDILATCAASGVRFGPFTQTLTVPKNTAGITAQLVFKRNSDCTGNVTNPPGLGGALLTVKLEWTEVTDPDAITFSTP